MKQFAPLLSLSLVLACQARPSPAPGTTPSTADDSHAAVATSERATMNVESFVKACQAKGAINFTYTKATQSAMAAMPVRAEDVERIPSSEVEPFATATLNAYGFSCKRIGPEHLTVLLISRNSG